MAEMELSTTTFLVENKKFKKYCAFSTYL